MQAAGELTLEQLPALSDALCPVCGGTATHAALQDIGGGRSVRACDICALVFVWPRVEQDFSGEPETSYYGDWQFLDLESVGGLYNDVMAERARLCGPMPTMPIMPPTILDVGCGAGHVLPHFRAHGWKVHGVDPWAAVTEIGRRYFRLPIETARIENATTVAADAYDIVLSVDVLQFTAEPASYLTACRAAMKAGGMIYMTVPNFGSAESRERRWQSHYFLPGSYISYFTVQTLVRLMESARFQDITVTPFGGLGGDGFLRVTARRPFETTLTWADLGGDADDRDLPPLDRFEVDTARLSPEQRFWRENGYLILPRLIPDDLIDRYCAVRSQIADTGGWGEPTPYLHVPEIRDLCLYAPLAKMLETLIGEPMALHLNLTGWVSTERDWHQDDYLNPPSVNGHYAAVWTALDDIKADSGPFEFVPGSHRWPFIRQDKVLSLLGNMDPSDDSWPWHSERLLRPFFEVERERHGAKVQQFLARRGDVLIWHARLLHRGSLAQRPGAERRAMIAHYSAAGRRPDMGETRQHGAGGHYFVLGGEKG